MKALHWLAGCIGVLAASTTQAVPYTDIYFFGDSLTDTGNVTTVYASVPKPPGAPAVIPGPPYDPQGRASNGRIYADVLAEGLGFDALASARGGNNFAYGGARTRYQLFGPPFLGLQAQVAQYAARPGGADAGALHVLWGGSNNLQDIFLGRSTDPLGQPIPSLGQTLGDMAGMLDTLYAEGARHLLVPNAPNLGRVPRVRELGGAPAQAAATGLVMSFNAGLAGVLDAFTLTHPDAHVIRFDSFAALESIVANAAAHGITNTTDRCYTGDDLGFTGGGTVCADPDSYLFWDGIHPTSVTHRLLGQAVLQVAQVPEPATGLSVALGLLMLTAVARTRRLRVPGRQRRAR